MGKNAVLELLCSFNVPGSNCWGKIMHLLKFEDKRSRSSHDQIWAKLRDQRSWTEIACTKVVSGGPMCGPGKLSQPAERGIPSTLQHRVLSSFNEKDLLGQC